MSDAASAPEEGETSAPTPKSPKKAKAKPTHPKTGDMVNAAIENLKERSGSSLQAIKKYIAANYKVDAEKMAPFIRKYLKAAVTSGSLVQTKGKGASGSFKLATAGEKTSVAKKPKAATGAPAKMKAKKAKAATPTKKATGETKAKKAATKKTVVAPKKASVKEKAAKPAVASASKAKKAEKAPAKKPKAPKPKKTAKPRSPKKAAPKKK